MSNEKYGTITLEAIIDADNLRKACYEVLENNGFRAINDKEAAMLRPFLHEYPQEIATAIVNGRYKPQPVRKVFVNRNKAKNRSIGIPTGTDQFVEQAVRLILSAYYEAEFSFNSFGFRQNKSWQDAVQRAHEYLNNGSVWVLDLGLANFFDNINHSKLLQVLSNRIQDGRVISLIHKFMRAPTCEHGVVGSKTKIGIPEGGRLSPILANILLNELDTFLDEKKTNFIRYVDDLCIFCGSKKACERKLFNTSKYIEKKLFLPLNESTTKIVKVEPQAQCLPFSFMRRRGMKRRQAEVKCT